jgi:hypothetical protein
MSGNGADPALVREVLRDVLAELLPDLVAGAGGTAPSSTVPTVPPPPVAAVHRPSGWHGAPDAPVAEAVSISNDDELAAFVHRLLTLCENPREREAIRSGELRFALRGSDSAGPARATTRRIDRGAVSERVVREAAATGTRLVLGPKAVLTPMGRDVARSLGVTIEKEKRC